MAETGMGIGDVAYEIGRCGLSSVTHFLRGTYRKVASRDDIIRAKIWDYLERHPVCEEDETIPQQLYPLADTQLILECADEARRRKIAIVVEGPSGTSKTITTRWLWMQRNREQRHDTIYFRCYQGITGMDLLRELCRLAGGYWQTYRGRILRNLVRQLRRHSPALLLIDEAQHLLAGQAEAFEQLRDVFDAAGCGCLLTPQFRFVRALSNGLGGELEQWRSRTPVHHRLRGVREHELIPFAEHLAQMNLPAAVARKLPQAVRVLDKNIYDRMMLMRRAGAPLAQINSEKQSKYYYSARRIRQFVENIRELKQIPGNEGASAADLAEAAIQRMLAPERAAL
jgi:DNA transposition AAA+ family ATPase